MTDNRLLMAGQTTQQSIQDFFMSQCVDNVADMLCINQLNVNKNKPVLKYYHLA